MIYIREKLWRLRDSMRNSKSVDGGSIKQPVEVIRPSNNFIFQLSDELLLRILTYLDVKDLIR